ncbi:MAG: DUF4386 family protein [Solirubrobacterales bacterium]|nr:DUF4386 family protein [Solirubrobacterales bacterium]MBV9917621.1 DUF4386 family protein [Solirubrobacterales bacterium]
MNRLSAQRLWASTGALAIALFAAGLLFGDLIASTNYPRLDAPPADVREYFLRNPHDVRALAFFHVLSGLALLGFITYLQMWLRRLDQRSARLAPVALAGGVTAAVFLLLSALLYRVLAEPAVAVDPALNHALLVASYLAGGPGIAVPLALPVMAGSVTAFRRGLLPAWLGWLGTGAVAACVLSAGILLGPMSNSSFFYGVLLVAAILSLVWVFATSVMLAGGA